MREWIEIMYHMSFTYSQIPWWNWVYSDRRDVSLHPHNSGWDVPEKVVTLGKNSCLHQSSAGIFPPQGSVTQNCLLNPLFLNLPPPPPCDFSSWKTWNKMATNKYKISRKSYQWYNLKRGTLIGSLNSVSELWEITLNQPPNWLPRLYFPPWICDTSSVALIQCPGLLRLLAVCLHLHIHGPNSASCSCNAPKGSPFLRPTSAPRSPQYCFQIQLSKANNWSWDPLLVVFHSQSRGHLSLGGNEALQPDPCPCFHASPLDEFPTAAVTKPHKLNGFCTNLFSCSLGGRKRGVGHMGLNSRCHQNCIKFWRLETVPSF